jgi:hypothetical protein
MPTYNFPTNLENFCPLIYDKQKENSVTHVHEINCNKIQWNIHNLVGKTFWIIFFGEICWCNKIVEFIGKFFMGFLESWWVFEDYEFNYDKKQRKFITIYGNSHHVKMKIDFPSTKKPHWKNRDIHKSHHVQWQKLKRITSFN